MRVISLLLVLLIAFPASAIKPRLSVEPYLGYSQFNFESEGVGDSKFGAVLGGRGGVEFGGSMFFAVDYHEGGPYILENNIDNEYLNRMWGAGLGLRSQKFLFWAGYYFDVILDDLNRNYVYDGTAYKASVGYLYKKKISFNIEYCIEQFHSVRNSPDTSFSLDVSVFFVSISAPIYLLK